MMARSWAFAVGAAMALTGTASAPAALDAPPTVSAVTAAGDPVIGGTLTAVATVTGDPEPALAYRWLRCEGDRPNKCDMLADPAAETYAVTEADRGFRLRVRVTATNA